MFYLRPFENGEEFCLLGYNAVYFVGSQPTFRMNVLACCLRHAGFLLVCLAYSSTERFLPHVPPKRRLTFNELHGVISQEIELFITTAEGTSDLTFENGLSEIYLLTIFLHVNHCKENANTYIEHSTTLVQNFITVYVRSVLAQKNSFISI
jgi:hypothetical protein